MKDRIYALTLIACIVGLPICYTRYREAVLHKKFSDRITELLNKYIESVNKEYKILTDYMLCDARNDCRQEKINLVILNTLKTASGSMDEEIENLIYERVKRIRDLEEKLNNFEKERDEELSKHEN